MKEIHSNPTPQAPPRKRLLGRIVGVPGVGEPLGRYTPILEQGEEVSLVGGDDALDFVASNVVVPAVEALDGVFAVCQLETAPLVVTCPALSPGGIVGVSSQWADLDPCPMLRLAGLDFGDEGPAKAKRA